MSDNKNNLELVKDMLYGNKNQVPLSENELISVCLTYPAALVAAADGNVDEAERLYLLNISESLDDEVEEIGKNPSSRLAAAERYRAFMWLLNNKYMADSLILEGIKEFIEINQATGNQIKEMMWSMAGVSDGVSKEEEAEITRICVALNINETLN